MHHHRHVGVGDALGHAPPLLGAGEDEAEPILPAEVEGAHDVRGSGDPDDHGNAARERLVHPLEVQPADAQLAQTPPIVGGPAAGVETRVLEELAKAHERAGHGAARRRHAALVEAHVEGGHSPREHLVGGVAAEIEPGARAGNEAPDGRRDRARHAPEARDRDERRARIESVGRAEGRPDGIGRLTLAPLRRGVSRRALEADLEQADRRARGHQASGHDTASRVDARRARGSGRVRTRRHDAAVANHHGARGRLAVPRPQQAVFDRVDRGRVLTVRRRSGEEERQRREARHEPLHGATSRSSPVSKSVGVA